MVVEANTSVGTVGESHERDTYVTDPKIYVASCALTRAILGTENATPLRTKVQTQLENAGSIVDLVTEIVTGSPHLVLIQRSPASSSLPLILPPLQLRDNDASGSSLASVLDEETTNCADLLIGVEPGRGSAARLRARQPNGTIQMRARRSIIRLLLNHPSPVLPSFLLCASYELTREDFARRARISIPRCWLFSVLPDASKRCWVGRRRRGGNRPGRGCHIRRRSGRHHAVCHRINEDELHRFYIAAKGDFSCLLSSVKKTILWRETYNILSGQELEVWSNMVFWHGFDVNYRPCLIVRLGIACKSLSSQEKPRFLQAI
ncbi:hypothetical protein U1Q18_041947, partial [Sarracenia purpurea var. burkii]